MSDERHPGKSEDGKPVRLRANELRPDEGRILEGIYWHRRSRYFYLKGDEDEGYFDRKEWDLIEEGERR